jgi:outer membrane lipoprotein-sorting protein
MFDRPRLQASCFVAAALLLLSAGLAFPADPEAILQEFDRVQGSVRTLSASFTETTTNPLLVDPLVAEGQFYMTKPGSIRWDYVSPEEMRFVIADDQYIGYFPGRKRAEKRNIARWSERIFRFIGLGQSSDELKKFYEIHLEESDRQIEGTHLLVFEPKKRRVRKRVEEVRFWLSEETSLPIKVEYRAKNGYTRAIDFHEILLNPDLAANLYTVDIPADVEITDSFSGMPGLSTDATGH